MIKAFGFTQTYGEAYVYKKVSGGSVAYIILYVDDLLLMGNDIEFLGSIKAYLNKCFSMKDLGEAAARVEKPSSLRVILEEKAQVKVLVERVVQPVRDGVTGMDLLEVFLSRRIQPLQACDHQMWMYSGLEDSTRIHPQDVSEDTVEKCLRGITGNKDNPRGCRRVIPFDHLRQPEQV